MLAAILIHESLDFLDVRSVCLGVDENGGFHGNEKFHGGIDAEQVAVGSDDRAAAVSGRG